MLRDAAGKAWFHERWSPAHSEPQPHAGNIFRQMVQECRRITWLQENWSAAADRRKAAL